MALQIQLRRDNAAIWTAANPVLASGEIGLELDTRKAKLGDGITPWNALLYWPNAVANLVFQYNDAAVAGAPHSTINFTGAGVSVVDNGGGKLTVTVPGGSGGITLRDEGVAVAGAPHNILNFIGAGVTVTNAGSGVANVNIPVSLSSAKVIKMPVTMGGYVSGSSVPNNNVVTKVTTKVITPFNNSPSLVVRFLATAQLLQDTTENDLFSVGINQTFPYLASGPDGRISVAVTGTHTQGSAEVYIEYVEVVP